MDAQSLSMTLGGAGGGALMSLASRISPLSSSSCRLSFAVPLRNPKFPVAIRASSTPASRTCITFHVDNTSIKVPLSQDAAMGLSKAIDDVLNTFREKEKAERPKRWESMEFRHNEDGVFVEAFCNPNAYANPFQAKVLITLNDDKLKISTEGQLSTIKAEIDQYVKAIL